MSELINTKADHGSIYRHLLWTVSAIALLGPMVAFNRVEAADDDTRPTVWIELGGQLERVNRTQDIYVAPFFDPPSELFSISPADVQRSPRYGVGGEGKITLTPQGTNWSFAASVRYGRSNGKRDGHQETTVSKIPNVLAQSGYLTAHYQRYADAAAKHNESHLVLDFQAGKDVGLGAFGRESSSIFSLGVRFAQFTSHSTSTLGEEPTRFNYKYLPAFQVTVPLTSPRLFRGQESNEQSFRGIGPSLSWNGSAPIVGKDSVQVEFDWGVNAALLFGRQKAHAQHHTSAFARYFPASSQTTLYQHAYDHQRSRSVIVPNAGGFAGVSLKFPNAKVSLGYRADFFFGAMDGGIDVRKTYDRNFYGPFATISIGLGG